MNPERKIPILPRDVYWFVAGCLFVLAHCFVLGFSIGAFDFLHELSNGIEAIIGGTRDGN